MIMTANTQRNAVINSHPCGRSLRTGDYLMDGSGTIDVATQTVGDTIERIEIPDYFIFLILYSLSGHASSFISTNQTERAYFAIDTGRSPYTYLPSISLSVTLDGDTIGYPKKPCSLYQASTAGLSSTITGLRFSAFNDALPGGRPSFILPSGVSDSNTLIHWREYGLLVMGLMYPIRSDSALTLRKDGFGILFQIVIHTALVSFFMLPLSSTSASILFPKAGNKIFQIIDNPFSRGKFSAEILLVKPRYISASRKTRLPADLTLTRYVPRALPVVSTLPVVRNGRPQGVDILLLTYEGGVSDLSSSVCVVVAHHTGVFLTLSDRRMTAGTWGYFRDTTPATYCRPRPLCGRLLIVLLWNSYLEQGNCIISYASSYPQYLCVSCEHASLHPTRYPYHCALPDGLVYDNHHTVERDHLVSHVRCACKNDGVPEDLLLCYIQHSLRCVTYLPRIFGAHPANVRSVGSLDRRYYVPSNIW